MERTAKVLLSSDTFSARREGRQTFMWLSNFRGRRWEGSVTSVRRFEKHEDSSRYSSWVDKLVRSGPIRIWNGTSP